MKSFDYQNEKDPISLDEVDLIAAPVQKKAVKGQRTRSGEKATKGPSSADKKALRKMLTDGL